MRFAIFSVVAIIFLFLLVQWFLNPKIPIEEDTRIPIGILVLVTIIPLMWVKGVLMLKQVILENKKR